MPLAREALVDATPIGGKTLSEHASNAARRAMDMADEIDFLSHKIGDRLFGRPIEKVPGDANAPEPPRADTVSGHLTEIDKALNVLSNARGRLLEVSARIGAELHGAAEPDADPFAPETETPSLTRRGGTARSPERYG